MKPSDIQQGRRLARLIDQLTREELSSVEILFDNPDPATDWKQCAVIVRADHTNPQSSEDFIGSSIIGCLLDALKSRGLTEETPLDDGAEY